MWHLVSKAGPARTPATGQGNAHLCSFQRDSQEYLVASTALWHLPIKDKFGKGRKVTEKSECTQSHVKHYTFLHGCIKLLMFIAGHAPFLV